jgi:serine/threonine protein kinase
MQHDAEKLFHQYFSLFDQQWYEMQDRYRPGDELLQVVRSIVPTSCRMSRSNKWFHVQPEDAPITTQGWKIHISATPANCESILGIVTKICYEQNTAFKFTVDRRFVTLMLSKIWGREGSGKFITVYPHNDDHFREIIELFYTALKGFEASYILSDRRYKDSQTVYYRYGGISGFNILTLSGDRSFMLKAPDGTAVPDWRTPYWNPPSWVSDPFGTEDDEDGEEATLKEGRYRIDNVLSFSVAGGVYLGTDLQNDSQVVIKEARPLTNIDEHGVDAAERLRREYRILQKLQGTGIGPEPLDFFQDWEHLFLVEEYIAGIDLGLIMTSSNPIIRIFPTTEAKEAHIALLRKAWGQVARNLQVMHAKGIVYGDLSIKNVIVTELGQGDARFIDFESAWEEGVDTCSRITTPGYASPTSTDHSGKADDIYGLGAIMLGSLFLINSLIALEPSTKPLFAEIFGTELGIPEAIQQLIEDCMNAHPLDRPQIQQVIEVLDTAPKKRIRQSAPVEPIVSKKELEETVRGIAGYIHASTDLSRSDRLFPSDPMLFFTNPLSMAYGASGVAYALSRLEGEVPSQVRFWILERPVTPDLYPPGLYVGAAGIAWALWEAGFQDAAVQTLRAVDRHPLLWESADLFYGASGYGQTCLRFYLATREQEWLDRAVEVGKWLVRKRTENELGYHYWPDAQGNTWIGYGRGASGISLYLLYLGIATGEQEFIEVGKRGMSFELSRLDSTDEGLLSTPRGIVGGQYRVLSHYWLDGSAGVITALVRFWSHTQDQEYADMLNLLAPDLMRKYTVFPGLFRGLAGLGNALLDLADFTGEERYHEAAHRAASGILLHRLQRPSGFAFPGEQLLRISTDFGTGSAGIGLFLDRLARHEQRPGNFNFTLDELLVKRIGAQTGDVQIKELASL